MIQELAEETYLNRVFGGCEFLASSVVCLSTVKKSDGVP